jgi:hypothetical protein
MQYTNDFEKASEAKGDDVRLWLATLLQIAEVFGD